jgi:hypothetical protein
VVVCQPAIGHGLVMIMMNPSKFVRIECGTTILLRGWHAGGGDCGSTQ